MVYAEFEVNKNYIASVLCENKARPQLHCNGRCYLMKKVKAVQEKERKQEREARKNSQQEALNQDPASVCFEDPEYPHTKYFPAAVPALLSRSATIFQPPKRSRFI